MKLRIFQLNMETVERSRICPVSRIEVSAHRNYAFFNYYLQTTEQSQIHMSQVYRIEGSAQGNDAFFKLSIGSWNLLLISLQPQYSFSFFVCIDYDWSLLTALWLQNSELTQSHVNPLVFINHVGYVLVYHAFWLA